MLRRTLAAATLVAAGLVCAPRVVAACDQNGCLPQVAYVTPQQVVLDGKPVRLSIQGYNLSGVTQVMTAPLLPLQGFTVYSDTTILVTLPANLPPGTYSLRVMSPQGGSDPSVAPQFEVWPAPPPTLPPTAVPKPTAAPKPTPTPTPPAPLTGVIVPVAATVHGGGGGGAPRPPAVLTSGAGQASPSSAPVAILVGLGLGGLFYLLWGSPRRLSGSWSSAPLAHLLGRPVQALHVGRICLYCGRMHFMWSTRRDLWKEGRYCGARCFIAAEAQPSPLAEEDEPEPVAEHKKAAWWHAAIDGSGTQGGWHPRF